MEYMSGEVGIMYEFWSCVGVDAYGSWDWADCNFVSNICSDTGGVEAFFLPVGNSICCMLTGEVIGDVRCDVDGEIAIGVGMPSYGGGASDVGLVIM